MVKRVINPNLLHLRWCFNNKKTGAILEGSSRSAKTWSSVDFVVYLCARILNRATINIIKETYNSFKTTLYDDFNRRLPDYGIRSPFADRQEVKQFKLFGNKINLLGADSDTVYHGAGTDIAYFNEMLDIPQAVFDQTEMRCRRFWWGDYNPKATDHWVYDKICNRDDVGFLKTTFKDNPYVAATERRKILSYQSVGQTIIARKLEIDKKIKIDDAARLARNYSIEKNVNNYTFEELEELRHCVSNERQGTADDYMWNVYGLGLRSAPEGIVFQHITWIEKFPTDIEHVYYGSDFGYTIHPSTLIRMGIHKNNMYLEKLFHQPTPSSNEYIPLLKAHVKPTDSVWADSADPGYIMDSRKAGMRVLAVNKFKGSVMYGISLMKKYKIHIVNCPEWRKEQSNYKFREVNGIRLEEPIDDFNHLWDASRYAALSNLRHVK